MNFEKNSHQKKFGNMFQNKLINITHTMETFWEKFNSGVESFRYDDEIVHVIPTSNPHGNNEDQYIVVRDDAYFFNTGNVEIMTKTEVEEKYKLSLL